MALQAKVKINRINNLSDARYTAGMGVEWAGFCLDPSDPECLDRETFTAITGWISGVKIVGEFAHCNRELITKKLSECPVDFIQTSDSQKVKDLETLGMPIILEIEASNELEATLEEADGAVAYFLVNQPSIALSDEMMEKTLFLSQRYSIILGFGLEPSNVMQLVHSYPLEGIALKGGQEIKPGVKDFDHLADILDALEIEG